MTPERQAILQTTGQAVIDLIGTEGEKHDLVLNEIIVMLISVVAHYLAGIPDFDVREHVYARFGAALSTHIEQLANSDDKAMVAMVVGKEGLQ
jgi:hypothetical protein